MKKKDIDVFFNPQFPIGSVVSSTETGRCGIITDIEVGLGWVKYSGLRFDGKRFNCSTESVIFEANSPNEFLGDNF